MQKDLSKLQIRSEVFAVLSEYQSDKDFNLQKHKEHIKRLSEIENKNFILEIMIKELVNLPENRENELRKQAIIVLFTGIAKLEDAEELIWEYIKNFNVADKSKKVLLLILKNLGAKIDSNIITEYMEDPELLVDEDTKELLETATIDPEAQIDFLDFISSLNLKEQLQLIDSIASDFQGDESANVLAPYLKSSNEYEVKKKIIEILANSKSYIAVEPLKFLLTSEGDDDLKRLVIKSLNHLKNSGIDIDDETKIYARENFICTFNQVYKCFISQIDGTGSQGIIFSRINDKKQIDMFSVVINSENGIIDCFGLKALSSHDFVKVVERFRTNSTVVPAPASFIKYKLLESEKINKGKNLKFPYEYICWKAYLYNVESIKPNYENLLEYAYTDISPKDIELLYNTEDFDSWFFEYEDNEYVDSIIDFITSNYKENSDDCLKEIENKISEQFLNIFNKELTAEIADNLLEAAYVYKLNNQYNLVNITANLSKLIKNSNNEELKKIRFLKDYVRRSIFQYLANLITEEQEKEHTKTSIFDKNKAIEENKNLNPQDAFELMNFLEEKWENAYFE